MTDPDKPCPHENTEATVVVVRLEDTRRHVAEIRIRCADCGEPFRFPDSIPVGVDLSGVTTSLDGEELRVGLRSSADFPESLLGG